MGIDAVGIQHRAVEGGYGCVALRQLVHAGLAQHNPMGSLKISHQLGAFLLHQSCKWQRNRPVVGILCGVVTLPLDCLAPPYFALR